MRDLKESSTPEKPRKFSAANPPSPVADSSPTPVRASNVGKLDIPRGIKVQIPSKDDKKKEKKDDKKKKEKEKEKEKEFDKRVRAGSVETVETSVVKASQLDNDFRKNLQNIMAQKR